MKKTVLYVGAGCDVRPLEDLKDTFSLFVFADGQPFSEFGTMRCPGDCFGCACTPTSAVHCYSRPSFLATLDASVGMPPTSVEDVQGCGVRRYAERNLVYFTNTALPERIDALRPHAPYDALAVAGHIPHASVVELLAPSCTMYGWHGTVYDVCEEEREEGALVLGTPELFAEYVYTTRAGEVRVSDTWKGFLEHYQSDRCLPL
jgi:hypothetical protein